MNKELDTSGSTESPREKMLFDFFQLHGINYQNHLHDPAVTVEESLYLVDLIPGAHSKNLFVKDKKKKYFLITVLQDKRVDLTRLAKDLQVSGRFSFGNPEELLTMLGVIPGSVTPFGLIHDTQQQVNFILDQDLMNHALLNFHPLRNDMTTSLIASVFLQFCELVQHKPRILAIPQISKSA